MYPTAEWDDAGSFCQSPSFIPGSSPQEGTPHLSIPIPTSNWRHGGATSNAVQCRSPLAGGPDYAERSPVHAIQLQLSPAEDDDAHYTPTGYQEISPQWSRDDSLLSISPSIYTQAGGSSGCPSPLFSTDQGYPFESGHSPMLSPSSWGYSDGEETLFPLHSGPPASPTMVGRSMEHHIYPVSLDPDGLWNRRGDFLQQLKHPNQTFYYKCSWPVGSGKCSAAFNVENEAFGHVGDHIARAKYACSCGKTYTEERSAKRHQRTERVKLDVESCVSR